MLGFLCTTAPLKLQMLPLVVLLRQARAASPFSGRGSRRASRRMAVRVSHQLTAPAGIQGFASTSGLAMAIPLERQTPAWPMLLLAAAALLLATAGLWRQETVLAVVRIALDGLRSNEVLPVEVDGADRPAMDPSLAWVVDPHSRPLDLGTGRLRRVGVQPFEYEVRPGETIQEIATRFGVDVSALLWNNGLDDAEQVQAGARLMILPVRGVLHLVKDGETLASIAERYGSRVEDLLTANALDHTSALQIGKVLVVAGGSVPMPAALPLASSGVLASANADEAATLPTPGPALVPVEETLPDPPGAADWQREFILKVAPGARASMRKTGVPASVALAQAILESDWGRSKLTREANNLFGIKAYRDPGTAGVYEINTWEVIGGRNVTVLAAFKAYTSYADSITDHGAWFHDNSRYHGALAVRHDPRAFAYAINAAGYATDPAYAPKLIQLMDRFNLYAYDVQEGEYERPTIGR